MAKKYYGKFDMNHHDELIGDTYKELIMRNIEVAANAEIKRGMLLSAATPEGVYAPATASDSGKYFVIAVDDFSADSDTKITQGYTGGVFNRERISDTNVAAALELELRRQNIHMTSIKDRRKLWYRKTFLV